MSANGKRIVIVALVIALAAVVIAKQVRARRGAAGSSVSELPPAPGAGLPALVDIGSTTCIPCKMMTPVLEELGSEFKGRLAVHFIDVNVDPERARQYRINVIPTQVFLDASGKELWRHEGFISKQDVLAKWTELGFNF